MQKPFFVLLSSVFFLACHNSNSDKTASGTAEPKPSKYSAAFNQSVQSAMDVYYNLTEAFVNWDSVKATSLASVLTAKLDSVQLNEIKADTSLYSKAETNIANVKSDLTGMMAATGIATKRHAFNALSDHLYQFLRDVKYDRQKLYLQECPMAFNDVEPGLWLSAKESIRNPYLGLHHPYYKSGMLECGETKEIVNFTGAQ